MRATTNHSADLPHQRERVGYDADRGGVDDDEVVAAELRQNLAHSLTFDQLKRIGGRGSSGYHVQGRPPGAGAVAAGVDRFRLDHLIKIQLGA
jgi:hypothetical protein